MCVEFSDAGKFINHNLQNRKRIGAKFYKYMQGKKLIIQFLTINIYSLENLNNFFNEKVANLNNK